MIKLYEKVKNYITENYLFLLFLLVFVTTCTYPLPYYIYTGGGLMDVDGKIEFKSKTKSKGSYNLCYVSEVEATLPTYLLSYVLPDWEMVKKDDLTINKSESKKDISVRDKVYLNSGNMSAVINAFKYANKEYKITNNKLIVVYVLENAKNDLKIGDQIIKIGDTLINEIDDITKALENKNIGDKVNIKVINNNKEYDRYAYIIEDTNRKLIGVSLEKTCEIETNPKINFNFRNDESGPSGGLILSLALYDYLVDEDLTKGLKISGTGTIDDNGNVGEIGGIKYKLKGAVSKKADIFFVPIGENYDEAIKLKKKHNYKIDIVGVKTFEEAVKYLENKTK